MRTWTAALAHIGLTAASAAAGILWFKQDTLGGYMANTGIQIGAQFGLGALQALIAKKNSNTNPDGTSATQAYRPLVMDDPYKD